MGSRIEWRGVSVSRFLVGATCSWSRTSLCAGWTSILIRWWNWWRWWGSHPQLPAILNHQLCPLVLSPIQPDYDQDGDVGDEKSSPGKIKGVACMQQVVGVASVSPRWLMSTLAEFFKAARKKKEIGTATAEEQHCIALLAERSHVSTSVMFAFLRVEKGPRAVLSHPEILESLTHFWRTCCPSITTAPPTARSHCSPASSSLPPFRPPFWRGII